MKYRKAVATAPTSLDEVRIEEAEHAALTQGEIRVKMQYAPIRPSDLNMLAGNYGETPAGNFTPGGEGSGVVMETLHDDFKEGDTVIPLTRLSKGTWSEIWQGAGEQFYRTEKTSTIEAAALRINPLSALLMLESWDATSNTSVLINAANSKVGHYMWQIAHHRQIPVVGTVRSEEARNEVLGCYPWLITTQVLLDTKESEHQLEQWGAEKPFSLALNAVGGESSLRQLRYLAEGGTQITYGAVSGKPSRLLASHLIFKDLCLKGFWLNQWSKQQDTETIQRKLRYLEGLSLKFDKADRYFSFH